MSTNEPMTQERLDAIQERLDAVQADPPDEYWSYGAGIAWVPFCEHAREDIPALVEHFDGRMELLHWADEIAARVPKTEALAA